MFAGSQPFNVGRFQCESHSVCSHPSLSPSFSSQLHPQFGAPVLPSFRSKKGGACPLSPFLRLHARCVAGRVQATFNVLGVLPIGPGRRRRDCRCRAAVLDPSPKWQGRPSTATRLEDRPQKLLRGTGPDQPRSKRRGRPVPVGAGGMGISFRGAWAWVYLSFRVPVLACSCVVFWAGENKEKGKAAMYERGEGQ